jgi:hypothetical protein
MWQLQRCSHDATNLTQPKARYPRPPRLDLGLDSLGSLRLNDLEHVHVKLKSLNGLCGVKCRAK